MAVQEAKIPTPPEQVRPTDETSDPLRDPLSWEPSLSFVRYSVGALLIGTTLFTLVVLLFYPELRQRLSGPLPMALVGLGGWYLLRRGRPQLAIVAMAIGMWVTVSFAVYAHGGVLAPAFYIFPMLIMLAGWLLGARASLAAAAVTSALTVYLVVADRMGWLPTPTKAPPVLSGIVQVCVFIVSALLVNTLVRAYRKQLGQLHTSNLGYAQRTRDLELVKTELHQAQAVAKVGSWVYEVAADSVRLSDEACRILGLPMGTQGTYESYFARVHPDDQASLEAAWRSALLGQLIFDHEHRVLRGPSVVWVRQKAEMEWAADGTVRRAIGITQDITERKLTELELRQSERKFAIAFTSCPLAASIATLDEGRFIEANDNYERDFGWPKSALIGHTTQEIGIWPEPVLRQQWVEAIRAKGRLVDYETVWRHKNGELRKVSLSGEIVDIEGITCILAYVTDITERKAAAEQIQNLAFFDPLTGLPNRRLLIDRLEQALAAARRHQRRGALLFIDLDHFKVLNDIHGHDKGDVLLREVAQRLSSCVPDNGSTVARLGGDEFVVMLEDLSPQSLDAANQAETVAEAIRARLNQSYQLGSQTFHSTPSIGVTLFGEQSEELEEPLRRADLAMYQAKSAGRNAIRFFDPQMQVEVTARATLELDLREALVQEQFTLHYQPQVDHSDEVVGVEALINWVHPRHGLMQPSRYIPLAEDTSLILPLGLWVFDQACRQLADWAHHPELAQLSVSINVSARQFQQENFVQQVLGALERSGADPRRLTLELTESVLVYNLEDVIAKMSALKARGVGFSLDDFGTGYSSLSYLKRLPLDQLKIDRTFVRDILDDPNDAAIARMVIVLAESLGLAVVAEGVETQAQRDALYSRGCSIYQGYLYSHPLPPPAFEQFMSRRRVMPAEPETDPTLNA